MNVEQRIATVAAAPGVTAAYQIGEAEALGGNLHGVNVVWWVSSGDVSRRYGGRLVASGYGTAQEAANWAGELPAVLAPAPVATGYITGRTVPFSRVQVEAFANAQWRAQQGYASAPDILGFEVDNLGDRAVRVSGLFWMTDGTRSDRGYVIRLVNPNGETSGDNVKFERIL